MTSKKPLHNDYRALRRIAICYARKKGCQPELAEDFAQEYCLSHWLGREVHISYQFVDFLRVQFGRTGANYIGAKSIAMLTAVSYEEPK